MSKEATLHKQLETDMMRDCPHLYADMYNPKTCMAYGITISKGWFDIVRRASQKIEAVILSLPEDQRHLYKAAQIKEKFGSLRWYMTGSNNQIEEIIAAAEDESMSVCEECGSNEGKMQSSSSGWLRTNCDKCYAEYKAKRGL